MATTSALPTGYDNSIPAHCPHCGALNAHLSGPPQQVGEGFRVPAICESGEHAFSVYVTERKGEVLVFVGAKSAWADETAGSRR